MIQAHIIGIGNECLRESGQDKIIDTHEDDSDMSIFQTPLLPIQTADTVGHSFRFVIEA